MITIKWLGTQIEESKRVTNKEKELIVVRTKVRQYYNLESCNSKFDCREHQ